MDALTMILLKFKIVILIVLLRVCEIMARTAIVTGANKGIGYEIAKLLSQRDPQLRIILACRNADLGRQAESSLKSNGCKNVEFSQLDITSRDSINSFVESLKRNHNVDRVDILVNNAAISFHSGDPTPIRNQAHPTMQCNYYGTKWLTDSLLPLLKNAAHPRIVNVASELGHINIIKNADLRRKFTDPELTVEQLDALVEQFIGAVEDGTSAEKGWPNSSYFCYSTSKVALIALTKVWARQHPGIQINACCPGWCATDLGTRAAPKTAAAGAKTPAFLALDVPDGSTPTGKFFADEREIEW